MLDPNRRVSPEPAPETVDAKSSFATFAASVSAAKTNFLYYLSTRTDRLLLVVKNAVVFGVLGIVAGLVGVTVVITATIDLCAGIVGGLEQLFGRYAWIAPLLFGVVVLGTVGLAGLIFIRRFTSGSKERLVSAYEQRQRRQRSKIDPGTTRRGARQNVG
jgi:cytochrome c biogenesis protein CcdA